MSTIEAYPLQWPVGWPRTSATTRQRANFSVKYVRSFASVRDELLNELRLLGVKRHTIVLSTNVPLRRDGLPYANQAQPEDVGIAVYFALGDDQKCFPCDKWNRIEDNMRAISLTINALRGMERWGSKQMVEAAFAGFAPLPAGGEDSPDAWWTVLHVEPDASMADIASAYKRQAMLNHPDRGGDATMFHRIQHAYEQARGAVMA